MDKSKTDQRRDELLGRMLATPPDPRVGSVRKKTKKRKKNRAAKD